MRAPRPVVLVLTCATVALAGCGSTSKLLDGTSAQDLQASIATVQQAAAEGRCDEATSAADEGLRRIDDLPSSVDAALKRRLRKGFQELKAKISQDCAETPTTTETTTEPPATETVPDETTTPETTPEPPTTPETTPEPPTTPDTTEPDTTTGPDDDGTDDGSGGTSGGTPPVGGVDGPSSTPRSALKELRENGRDTAKELRRALKDAREAAKDALR